MGLGNGGGCPMTTDSEWGEWGQWWEREEGWGRGVEEGGATYRGEWGRVEKGHDTHYICIVARVIYHVVFL